jgi:Sec-independent protein translocase protein TatA
MISKIINYSTRLLVIIIGFVLVFGDFTPENTDDNLVNIVGIIFILFGAYRLISYHYSWKKYSSGSKDRDNDDDLDSYDFDDYSDSSDYDDGGDD